MSGKQTKKQGLFGILILTLAMVTPLFGMSSAYAVEITTRSLTLQTPTGGDGGSMPGGTVNNKFDFTVPTTGTGIGSIKFQYCDTASNTCATPTGMNASGAAMGAQTGGATGFTMSTKTTNSVLITRASASNPTGALSLTINNVVNPTTANYTFYVRISTYSSTNGTGTPIDTGVVAASTANQIDFTGYMPETLVFCTGVTVDATCQSVTNATIDLGTFSPTATTKATSEMAASTNSLSGYVITVEGNTLTNGSVTIPAMTSAATPTIGKSEFGLNIVHNTSLSVGADVTPAYDGNNYTGTASSPYATDGTFAFNDTAPQTVASSTGPSAGQKYTSSYIVDVAGNQLAGTYTTTLTYICTSTY